MKCKLTRPMESGERPGEIMPTGTEIDHADAWMLVRLGCAEPHDEECSRRAAMTPEKMEAARRAYDRKEAGIVPEDFEAFDRGEMTGYFPDGSPIPGPNAPEPEPSEFEEMFLS